jgi:molecular chaperone GrpE
MNTQRPSADRHDQGKPRPAADADEQSAQGEAQVRPADDNEEDAEPGDQTVGTERDERPLERDLEGMRDRLMRALAEQENARRRAQRDREEAVRYANADLARDLLPIIDNLTRALDSLPEEDAADASMLQMLRGISAIERQMLQALERHGIQRFEPIGEAFDPHLHHAVLRNDTSDQPAGTVTEVLQPGYLYNDRLLRPAMVGVAGEATTQAPSADEMRHTQTQPRHR